MRLHFFFLFIPAVLGFGQDSPVASNRNFGVVPQATINSLNSGSRMADLAVSDDGQHVAIVRYVGTRKAVVFDGTESQIWDELGSFSDPEHPDRALAVFQMSATGGHWAYIARDNGRIVLVVDNKPVEIQPRNYRSAGVFKFLADGGYVMSTFDNQRGAWVILNGTKLGPYREIKQLTVSADEKHVGFVGLTGPTAVSQGADSVAVIDGKEGIPYLNIADLQLSADGIHHVYAVEPPYKGSITEGWKVVRDAKVSTERYQRVSELQMSTDGKHYAYVGIPTLDGVNPSGGMVVVFDGKATKNYNYVQNLTLSPDGTRVAFAVMHPVPGAENQMKFVADGVESRDYPWYSSTTVVFSPDSKSVGFVAGERILYVNNQELPAAGMSQGISLTAGKTGPAFAYRTKGDDNIVRVFVNGVQGPELASANLDRISFNPSGTDAAYFARATDNKSVLVIGTQVVPLPERSKNGSEFLSADSTIIWSSDGAHYAVTSRELIIDGKLGPTCGSGKLGQFSPDGEHFAIACPTYEGKGHTLRYRILLDGKTVQTPDALVLSNAGSFRFGANNMLEVVAVVGFEASSLHFTPPANGLENFKPESDGAQVSATPAQPAAQSNPASQPAKSGQQPAAPLDVQLKDALQKKLPKIFGGKK